MGYFILCISFPYLPGSLILPVLLKNVPKKLQFVLSLSMICFGYMLFGPSNLLSLPDYLGFIIAGMIIIGFFVPIGFI